jgi:hypothetical protein
MRILSSEEGQEWLTLNLWNQLTERSLRREFSQRVSYLLPADAGKKTGLARRLTASVDYTGEGLLWIDAWGIWPSCENMRLFQAYRKSLREERPLQDAPFHVFTEPDSHDVECLLDLALYFFWDVIVLEGSRSKAVRISHDEYIDLYARNHEGLAVFENSFSGLDLKVITEGKPSSGTAGVP